MNDEQRAALVDELAEAIHAADEHNGHMHYARKHVHAIMPIIDRLLAAAPAPGLDDDAVERAAIELADFEDSPAFDDGHDDVSEQDYYRRKARAALTAAATAPGLDELLDSVHPEAAASLQFIQPYLTTDPEPYWQAHVNVPTGGLTGFQKHRGTGPTRTAAIQAAVAEAKKGAGQ